MNSFKSRLQQARLTKGISISEAAKRTGIPETIWKCYEQGTRSPTIETLCSICSALTTSADWLLSLPEN